LTELNEQLTTAAAQREALVQRINQLDHISSQTELDQLNERIDAIDISRSDTIQRLASMQSQIRALREQLDALQ
jgi:uncharacterized coiled-coil DUF342 family protein